MAITFTPITLEEMDKFLKRGFRSLKPTKNLGRIEIYYDLTVMDDTKIGIRVWTSIASGRDTGAGVGDDAIRVQLYHFGRNKPLKSGKAPIVKRTQNWRDSLTDRIEDYLEAISDHEEALRAGAFINWA